MVVTLKNQMQSHPYRISNSCICNVKGKKEKSSATGHLRPIKKKSSKPTTENNQIGTVP